MTADASRTAQTGELAGDRDASDQATIRERLLTACRTAAVHPAAGLRARIVRASRPSSRLSR